MSGPTIDRAGSSGDIWTPQVFIGAVEKRFGFLEWDLAASDTNHKAPGYFTEQMDAFAFDWAKVTGGKLSWLNPPFSHITPWALKCAAEKEQGAEILLLVPASVGANWYWDHVEPWATVYSVGRMVFDNCFDRKTGELVTTPYAKDLILAHYDPNFIGQLPRMQRWRWQDAGRNR